MQRLVRPRPSAVKMSLISTDGKFFGQADHDRSGMRNLPGCRDLVPPPVSLLLTAPDYVPLVYAALGSGWNTGWI